MSTCSDNSLSEINSAKTYDKKRVIFLYEVDFNDEASECESVGENINGFKTLSRVNTNDDSVTENSRAGSA